LLAFLELVLSAFFEFLLVIGLLFVEENVVPEENCARDNKGEVERNVVHEDQLFAISQNVCNHAAYEDQAISDPQPNVSHINVTLPSLVMLFKGDRLHPERW
jgi:hypothetical protein